MFKFTNSWKRQHLTLLPPDLHSLTRHWPRHCTRWGRASWRGRRGELSGTSPHYSSGRVACPGTTVRAGSRCSRPSAPVCEHRTIEICEHRTAEILYFEYRWNNKNLGPQHYLGTIFSLFTSQFSSSHVPVLEFSSLWTQDNIILFSDAGKTKICEHSTVLEPLAIKALVVQVQLLQLVSTGQQQNSHGLVACVQQTRTEVNARCSSITDHAGSRWSRVVVVAINIIIIDRFYIALFSAFMQTHSRISI